MKTVFTNDMVAHVWAQQKQSRGQSGNGNFSFDGTKLYSYSATIANFVTDKRKARVVLISKRYERYSKSTSAHVTMARRSVAGTPCYVVPDIDSDADHNRNCRELLAEYHDDIERAKKMRNSPNYIIRHAEENLATIRDYAERFGVKLPLAGYSTYGKVFPKITKWPNAAADIAAVENIHIARNIKANDPKTIAKAERAAERRIENMRRDYREATGNFGPEWNDWRLSYRSRESTLAQFTEEDKAARRETLAAHWAERVAQYRAGDYVGLPHGLATEDDIAAHNAARREIEREAIQKYRDGGASYVNDEYLTEEDKIARDQSLRRLQPETLARYLSAEQSAFGFERNGWILTDAERATNQAALATKAERDIARWRLGESVSLPHFEFALLRLRGDEVQTSQGATFPVSHAMRAFPLVQRVVMRGEEWHTNGHKIPLGHFQVDRITKDGIIHAGCHKVAYAEASACYVLILSTGAAIYANDIA